MVCHLTGPQRTTAQAAQINVFRAELTAAKSAYNAQTYVPPATRSAAQNARFWQGPLSHGAWAAAGNAGVPVHAAIICVPSLQNLAATYTLAGGGASGACWDVGNERPNDLRVTGAALRPPPASESARRAPTRASQAPTARSATTSPSRSPRRRRPSSRTGSRGRTSSSASKYSGAPCGETKSDGPSSSDASSEGAGTVTSSPFRGLRLKSKLKWPLTYPAGGIC